MIYRKTVLVTGAGSGIGLAAAKKFIENDCRVILCGRTLEKLNAAADNLGSNAAAMQWDVRDIEKIPS